MRYFKKFSAVIIFLAAMCVINSVLTYVLEPAEDSSSATMWSGYNHAKNIDTIYVGSSLCHVGFNPDVLDPITGYHSYNMGTNAQMLAESYMAIDTAIREKHIKRVVFGFGYFCMQRRQSIGSEVAFYRARGAYGDWKSKLTENMSFLFSAENFKSSTSINYFFPWIYDHCTISGQEISNNLNDKKEKSTEAKQTYTGNGYAKYGGQLNYDAIGSDITEASKHQKFDRSAYQELAKICRLCEKNNVKLDVIVVPEPDYYVVAYGTDYFKKKAEIEKVCADNGAAYYDFNLAKPELYDAEATYYADYEHLNETGATAFSKSVAYLLNQEDKQNMNDLFYTPEEYLKKIDYVTCVNYTSEMVNGTIIIKAKAYTGNTAKAEYQFMVYDKAKKEYSVIKEYSADSECKYKMQGKGTYLIRVNARIAGESGTLRYYEKKIRVG